MVPQQQKVAVTGASGFIGGRVVERLILDSDAEVVALARGYGRLSRLSILPQDRLTFQVSDLSDSAALASVLAGCDTVVHCAFGNTGEVEERWRTTVDGTAAVLAAARAAGVARVVHLSTIDVYDPVPLHGDFDESAGYLPEDPADLEYERQKLAAEKLVLAAHGDGVECVVLQPGIVYGPWGVQWTRTQLDRLPADNAGLPTGTGGGVCNAVYVDDLVDAVLAAIVSPDAAGGRFLINSDEMVCWGRFFDQLRAMLGLPCPPEPAATSQVPDWEQDLYRRTARARGDAAAAKLGFRATTGLAEGMAITRQWAEWMGLLRTST